MRPTLIIAALGLLLSPTPLLPAAQASGLNCHGSYLCGNDQISTWPSYSEPDKWAKYLRGYIHDLPDDTWLPQDHLIACVGNHICAYVTHHIECPWIEDLGMWASEAKWLADKLVHHGCKRCGQIAKGWPFEDEYGRVYLAPDWCKGWLKFDWVEHGFDMCGVRDEPGGICDDST